ncbi:MAG TPA: PilZ domain-containing protein [Anaeromyxobacter sp.]|nr:PilZ domain-containing protein [Anaeromyxobacter sp.]
MPEYLDNPRRVPRDPVRCRAHVASPTGKVETTTEDIGARGCQVVLPTAPERGAAVALTLSAPRVGSSLRIGGRVAWVSPRPPWRVGIAFTPECLGEAARWMETLRQTTPELFGTGRRLHEKVAVDAMVFLGAPPRLADFGDDEIAVLRKVWAGIKVAELRASFAGRWPRMQRSFFALLAQGYLTLSRAASAHPVRWREILGEPRPMAPPTILTAADLEPDPEPLPVGAPARAQTPPPDRTAAAVPPPLPTRAAPPPSWSGVDPARRTSTPVPDFVGAGVGWRGATARPRSAEADTLFQLALVELQEKNHHQALKLLRSALTLAPGDSEIADAIARAMATGR